MLLERIYEGLSERGLIDRWRLSRSAFRFAYFQYKRFLEDPFGRLIRECPHLFHGGHIIDLGANMGYTANLFARAIEDGWRVVAFEPDASNFAHLAGLGSPVTAVHAAAGSVNGSVRFWRNPRGHADHRILTERFRAYPGSNKSTSVQVYRLDDYVADRLGRSAPICFCKIDVQGYEVEVLRGMRATIENNPGMSIAVEYAPRCLSEMGAEPRDFFAELDRYGFSFFKLRRRGRPNRTSARQLYQQVGPDDYVDILCTHRKLEPPENRRADSRQAHGALTPCE